MSKGYRHYLKLLALPLTYLLIMVSLYVFWDVFNLPSAEVLGGLATRLFDQHGLPIVGVSAFVEGLFLVGNYFPGSFVIMLGIALSDSVAQAFMIFAVGTIALMVAHVINYQLGKHGWYKLLQKFGLASSLNESKTKIEQKGRWAILSSYWLPSLGSLIDTAAGILQMNFKKFLLASLAASIFWNGLVTIITYSMGDKALEILQSDSSNLSTGLGIIVIWCVVLLVKDSQNNTRK